MLETSIFTGIRTCRGATIDKISKQFRYQNMFLGVEFSRILGMPGSEMLSRDQIT